ncbi:virulence-associated E family protein [Nostoc sp.]|uniref:virulence-associated E family protein n=1 Tax=Nostoc sp. TaxID=1180 RepID=UPI002FF94CFE
MIKASLFIVEGEPCADAHLIGSVARACKPGCKKDEALILYGDQGINKSTFFEVLYGKCFFDDTMSNMSDKDEVLKLHRFWVVEWAELEAVFKRKDIEQIKSFLTTKVDSIRPPYARDIEELPRCSVIVATTNNKEQLNDPSGNRRFWFIPVTKKIDFHVLEQSRDRIWASAYAAYQNDEIWWLTDEEEVLSAEDNEDYQIQDVWVDHIQEFLIDRTWTTISQILLEAFSIEQGKQERRYQMRVADILKKLG